MKVSVKDIGSGRREARIEAEWEKIEPDYRDLVEEYSKFPVPGFRPGKAPTAMVEKEFREPILEDLGIRCAGRIARVALEGEGITTTGPVGIVEISVEYSGPISLTADFTELPEFTLPDTCALVLESDSDEGMRDEISEFLLEHTVFDVPDELVRQELLFDGLEDPEAGSDEWNAALARVKLLLILGSVARRDGIDVDDRDVEDRIAQIASEHGTDSDSLKKQLMRSGGLSRISSFLLAEMTLDYLIDTCK